MIKEKTTVMDSQSLPWAWEGRTQLCAGHLHVMNHSTADILGGIVPCGLGVAVLCARWGVYQQPWPPPTSCQ